MLVQPLLTCQNMANTYTTTAQKELDTESKTQQAHVVMPWQSIAGNNTRRRFAPCLSSTVSQRFGIAAHVPSNVCMQTSFSLTTKSSYLLPNTITSAPFCWMRPSTPLEGMDIQTKTPLAQHLVFLLLLDGKSEVHAFMLWRHVAEG